MAGDVPVSLAVDLPMIEAAEARLRGHALTTPLLNSPRLDRIAGRRVLVKAECLQRTGSFKFRGAWAALSSLPAGTKGVIAYSSGNHAQGVALAAGLHGLEAVILMPADAPAIKIANTRALGAEVVLYDRATQDRDALGAALAAERGLALIPPFDHAQVIAGQASVGLEIAAQAGALGVTQADVLVCCGGGGLTSGIALALAARNPARSGLCDAIVTPAPGKLTWPILRAHCGPGLVVSDEQALRAMALAFEHLKIVLEPGGAVALAAALFHGALIAGDTVIAIASGGNVDRAVFIRALEGV